MSKPNDLGKAAGLTAKDGQTLQRCCGRLETVIKTLDAISDSTGQASEVRAVAQDMLDGSRGMLRDFFSVKPMES